MIIFKDVLHAALLTTALLAGFMVAGCEQKERVLDIETPGGSVEVDRNTDSGKIEVDISNNETE